MLVIDVAFDGRAVTTETHFLFSHGTADLPKGQHAPLLSQKRIATIA